MEAAHIIWRTVLIYFVIYLVIRLMGKREIGKLSVFDLVISIMITELAVIVVEDSDRAIWEGVLPIAVLAIMQVGIAYLTLKSRKLRLLFDGKPSYVIQHGKLNPKEMSKQRYSLDDLMLQLRENKITNVADVEFAMLEPTGKLTVTKKSDFQSGGEPKGSGKEAFRYEGLPIPLVMDGKVQEDNLERVGQTRFWLKRELASHGVKDVKDVFLCTIDHRGKLFIDKK
ncbi:DUF421 domain-containing protein [Paenibacillus sp. TRM 82003]|nr:DUF421 domain-containing protein [Paenibacillus sp. TRM 82003]